MISSGKEILSDLCIMHVISTQTDAFRVKIMRKEFCNDAAVGSKTEDIK